MKPLEVTKADEELVRIAVTEFVLARVSWERVVKGRAYADARASFIQTFDEPAWKAAFDRVVEENDLGGYIFDHDSLRDGD